MEIDLNSFAGKRTLVMGEVKTGKTAFLLAATVHLARTFPEQVTVMDLAPETTRGIGGKIAARDMPGLIYLTAPIIAPRLLGNSPREVEALAAENARLIEQLFKRFAASPSRVLVINDVSIYLQAGDPARLKGLLGLADTVLMNGYFGKSLGGGDFGERERAAMRELARFCDLVLTSPLEDK